MIRRLLEDELPFGRLVDMGMVEYREFACSWRTLSWLRAGGMRQVDGVPVTLAVADTAGPNVVVQARPEAGWAQVSPSYAWQAAA